MPNPERQAAMGSCRRFRVPSLGPQSQPVHLDFDLPNGPKSGIEIEDRSDRFGFRRIDDEFAVFDVITQRNVAPHPHSLLLRRRHLVPDSLACDLPLELGKGREGH
jgi:hypothetical protein